MTSMGSRKPQAASRSSQRLPTEGSGVLRERYQALCESELKAIGSVSIRNTRAWAGHVDMSCCTYLALLYHDRLVTLTDLGRAREVKFYIGIL